MSPGRNDPCPCGSGKKYKRCCLVEQPDPLEFAARRIRAIQDEVEPKVVRFARGTWGEHALDTAWEDFTLDRKDLDRGGPEFQLFLPWFLYQWRPRKTKNPKDRPSISSPPLAGLFLQAHGDRLKPDERRFLEATMVSPLSFHDVLEVEPGCRVLFRDIFLQTQHGVHERSGSQMLQVGDIVFGRIVPYDSLGLGSVDLLIGSGSIPFPPIRKGLLLDLRKSLRKTLGEISIPLLHAAEPQLRELYFMIRAHALNPPLPILQNTDGEPLEFHTLSWTIASPDEAFRALAALAHEASEEELLEEATLGEDGRANRAEFPWTRPGNKMHAHWENTILGHIRIEGQTLTIEVNSTKRAKKIQAEIRKRLGSRATLLEHRIQSMEEALQEGGLRSRTEDGKKAERESRAFQSRPDVQAATREMARAHWDAWPTRKIPALGNKTPLQAMRDPEGREMVEALLLHYESGGHGGMASDINHPDMLDRVRKRLGLKTRLRSLQDTP